MSRTTWLRNWTRSLDRRWALHQVLQHDPAARRRGVRPRLEVLEDRWLLSAYIVTSTGDSGTGTLRNAINAVNGGSYNEIDFNIGTVGSAQTISPTSQLPAITASGVYVNGLSQGGSGNTTRLITLDGTYAGSFSVNGLELRGSQFSPCTGCVVSGLIIENFSGDGVLLMNGYTNDNTIGGTASGAGNVISANGGSAGLGMAVGASGNVVQGNYIGTDVTGSSALANSGDGILLQGPDNIVGGTVAGARNIISGNGNYGVYITDQYEADILVEGNYIGTDVTGNNAVANSQGGISVSGAANNTIGGTVSAARNVISGNSSGDGILITNGGSQKVLGNYIGINAAGTAALANSIGIEVQTNNCTIGGSVTGASNTIADNSSEGVLISSGYGNTISENTIYTNGSSGTGPGIVLNRGGNEGLAAPSLSSATLSGTTLTVTGTFTTPSGGQVGNYVLEFFANPSSDAEGNIFLGSLGVSVTTLGTQNFTFTTTTSVTGTNPLITATVTDPRGSTSAFSSGVLDPPVSNPPANDAPTSRPLHSPTNGNTPPPTPFQAALEFALDTAALFLQNDPSALLELQDFSVLFLGHALPPASELFSTILYDLSLLDSSVVKGL